MVNRVNFGDLSAEGGETNITAQILMFAQCLFEVHYLLISPDEGHKKGGKQYLRLISQNIKTINVTIK